MGAHASPNSESRVGRRVVLSILGVGLIAGALTAPARVFPPDATPAQNMQGPPTPRGWPAAATEPSATQPVDIPQAHMHPPAETIAMTRVPPGYHLELTASEPDIIAPVCLAWDGDGRMYAAEMQSYMLDLDASHEHDPMSRVIRFEDTKGTGTYDRHTVFADHLILPRMILPLDDRILIRETNTKDIYSYRDTTGTGIADEKKPFYTGGVEQGNVEHQSSGLLWNIDNWIYQTADETRFRYKDGKLIESKLPAAMGQWGIAMEDSGQMIFSQAGSEHPAQFFQAMPQYGPLGLPGDVPPHFNEVYPILPTTDIQGGLRRLKMGGGLSHFTGCGGGSIYCGDALPHDLYGDYLLPEPVGRLIRRAKLNDEDGKWVLSNACDHQEFIASMDANFRPVWTATGPDGCLYICDMYHGIIQEAEWDKPGTFLRPQIEKYGLQKNILHGRIYRLTYDGMKRREKPHMLEETPAQLVAHLSDPNGWWRDTAQKLLVLRGDKSVVPALVAMARQNDNPLARLHALWTLEGLDAVPSKLVMEKLRDADERVRCAAVRISEPLLERHDAVRVSAIAAMAASDSDPHVASQVGLSLLYCNDPGADATVAAVMASRAKAGLKSETPKALIAAYQAERLKKSQVASRQAALARRNPRLAAMVEQGRALYAQTCIACHGPDGRGMPSPAGTGTLAPPLAGSKRLMGNPEIVCRIVLRGLVGPNDGVIYPNEMAGFPWADDQWISSILTYARQEWGNTARQISVARVAKVRRETADRVKPFTLAELAELKLPAANAPATAPSPAASAPSSN
jgi:mono/diheme cytochrome c family protein